jgi:hypothetical protein
VSGQPEKYDDVVAEFGPLSDYERGFVDGLADYAWWKDGRMQVGTTGITLAQAARRFLQERRNERVAQAREPWNEATGEGVDLDHR